MGQRQPGPAVRWSGVDPAQVGVVGGVGVAVHGREAVAHAGRAGPAVAEAELFQQLRALVQGRSALLISHRFSTVRMADRIYVVEDGRILESGSHEELLLQGGRYAHLFGLQAAPYRDGLVERTLDNR